MFHSPRSAIFRIAFAASLAIASLGHAQTSTWTGAASGNWGDAGNWTAGVPTATTQAIFNSAANDRTGVALGGVARPIGSILFDTAATNPFTFSGAAGDALIFSAGGTITGNANVLAAQTFASPIQALGALTITNNIFTARPLVTNSMTFSGAFAAGGGPLTIDGAGTTGISGAIAASFTNVVKNGSGYYIQSNAANLYTGSTTVNGGIMAFPNVNSLGDATQATNTITLANNATLQYSGGTADLGVNRVITLNSGGTLGVSTTATILTLSAPITGTGAFTKTGLGQVNLNAASTYSGATIVEMGTLNLNFAATGAPTDNLLPTTSNLNLINGTLAMTGSTTANNSQTFASTTINALSGIAVTSGTGFSANLNLGTITRNANGLVNFTLPASGAISTTTANTAGSILGSWATVGGNTWAVSGVGAGPFNVTGLTTYTPNTWAAGNNTDVTATGTVPAGSTTNSLRFNTAGALTLTLSGVNTITSGGILLTSTVGANTTTLTGGTLTGSPSGELTVINNNTNAISIASIIANNGGATRLLKYGAGQVTLSGANTYTGSTLVARGLLTLNNNNALGGSPSVDVTNQVLNDGNGSILELANNITIANKTVTLNSYEFSNGRTTLRAANVGTWNGPVVVQGNSIINILSNTSGANFTITGPITGNNYTGFLFLRGNGNGTVNGAINLGAGAVGKTDGGTWVLNAPNNVWSNLQVVNGTIRLGAANALTPTAGVLLGQSSSTGTLDLNGFNQTIGGLTVVAGSGGNRVITNSSATVPATLTVDNPFLSIYGGDPVAPALGVFTGNLSLVKSNVGTLVLSGPNTYTGTTTISAGKLQIGQGGTTGTLGAGAITNNALLAFDRSDALTVPNAISGTGSVLKVNTNTLTFTGPTTYTGTTTVSGGTLRSATLGATSTLVVNDNSGYAQTAMPGPMTLAAATLGASAGNAALTVELNGAPAFVPLTVPTLTTNGANNPINVNTTSALALGTYRLVDYTGAIGGAGYGAFVLGALPPRATATLVNNTVNTSIDLNVTAYTSIKWSGASSAAWDINTTANWITDPGAAATNYLQPSTVGDSVIFDDTAVGNYSVTLNTVVNPSGMTFNNSTNDYTISGTGGLGGASALIKSGTGVVTLATNNTFTGTVTINAGTLQIGAGAATGTLGTGPVVDNGTLTFNRSDALVVPNTISGTGRVIQAGTAASTTTLSGPNTYTGGTVINSGTLIATSLANGGTASSIGSSTSAASNLVLNGGGLRYAGGVATSTDRNFALGTAGGAIEASGTAGAATLAFTSTAPVDFNGQSGARVFTLGGSNTGLNSFAPVLGDNGGATALVKAGTGTWVIPAATVNTYTGTTSLTGGILEFSNAGNLGAGTEIIFNAGGLRWAAGNTTDISTRTVTLTGTGNLDTQANDVTLANPIGNNGAGGLTKNGSQTSILTLNGNNTFTGAVNINGGSVRITNSGGLGTGTKTVALTNGTNGWVALRLNAVGGDITLPSTISYNTSWVGNTTVPGTIINEAGNNTIAGTITMNSGGGDTTVFVQGGTSLTLSGAITSNTTARILNLRGDGSGVISGVIADGSTTNTVQVRRDSGAGVWNLSGANTYTLATTVSGGTLIVTNTSGSGTGTGSVNISGTGAVGTGGTFGGTGSSAGPIVVSTTTTTSQGGTVAPGLPGAVGKLSTTAGASFWNRLGNYQFQYDAQATNPAPTTTSDFLEGTGTATLSLANLGTAAGQQFNVTLLPSNLPASTPGSAVTYTLATYTAVTAPTGATLPDLTPYFTFTGLFASAPTVALNGTSVQITFVPVPEPGAILLACGLAAGGATWIRRRRHARA